MYLNIFTIILYGPVAACISSNVIVLSDAPAVSSTLSSESIQQRKILYENQV